MPCLSGNAHKAFLLFPVLALTLAACSKGAPEAVNPRAAVPAAPYASPALTPEANEALKERLARQEAAARLFDKTKPEPPPAPARATVAKAVPVEVPRPAISAAPVVAPAPAPPKSEPAPPAVKAAAIEAPKPAPVQVASAPAASASAPPAGMIAPARLVSRADLEFPREAMQAGVDRGLVKARMTLDGNGNVTKVEVVEATPRRLFDRAVVRSLVNWRFNEGPSGRTVETEVEFRR